MLVARMLQNGGRAPANQHDSSDDATHALGDVIEQAGNWAAGRALSVHRSSSCRWPQSLLSLAAVPPVAGRSARLRRRGHPGRPVAEGSKVELPAESGLVGIRDELQVVDAG
jgi:hypothetical protein